MIEKDFESPLFATYTLLCDKLSRHSKDKDMLAGNEQPRRGSRGSILSGKGKRADAVLICQEMICALEKYGNFCQNTRKNAFFAFS